MPSYLITGANGGLGTAFLENLSSDPNNTVIGLVRRKAETDAKIAAWNKKNIHIVQADMMNYDSLKSAVETTSQITGGSLDYLILNAAYMGDWSAFDPLSVLGREPARLEKDLLDGYRTNVVGGIHLTNLSMPLILKGNVKKVVSISSGHADTDIAAKWQVHEAGPYAISKAATNMAMAKFHAEFAKDGVLFLSISPGVVDVGRNNWSPEEFEKLMAVAAKFKEYDPNWAGPGQPPDAVKAVLAVIEKASVANGDGGAFLSHHGNKHWL
ncbi:short-chain dehydrogenase [Pyrenochaeta sp. DS3sAY3a]|nr:short-chain dehydrogenase [Pyrenochaeta sp. DS3sAY3a]